jgi:hypothetical protein
MARVDATAAKAAAALAAAQLTVIMQDDTIASLAADNKENATPMRRIESLFILDADTGVYTSNDAYIDSAYAGNFPHKTTANQVNAPRG